MVDEKKYIWLIRHGKSAWPAGVPDMERPLNNRGRRDATIMASVLAEQDKPPQLFHSSDSERTKQTTSLINEVLQVPIVYNHDLYTANCSGVERVLSETDAKVNSVAVVSHLPTIDSCLGATHDWPQENAIPTLAVACCTFNGTWVEVDFSRAQFKEFFVPRMFRNDAN